MGGEPEPAHHVRSRSSPAVVVALACAASACGVFSLPDFVPPDAATLEAVTAPCDAGTSCTCPSSTLISTGPPGVAALHIDANYVYWIAGTTQSRGLYRAPLDGREVPPTTLVAPPAALAARDLAVDGPFVYFVETTDAGTAALARVPIAGGRVAAILTSPLPQVPVELSGGPGGLYWTDDSAEVCFWPSDPASAAADSGCGSRPFAPSFDPDASTAPDASNGNHLAVGGPNVYLAVNATGDIWQVPTDGRAPSLVYPASPDGIVRFAANDAGVFWTADSDNRTSNVYGSSNCFTTERPNDIVYDLQVDDANVYLLASYFKNTAKGRPGQPPSPQPPAAPGTIWKVPQTDGTVQQLVACNVHPEHSLIAVDSRAPYIVWADSTTGQVRSVAAR